MRSLVAADRGVRALELQSDGKESVLYELRPHRVALGEISPDTLLRHDPRRARPGTRRPAERTKRANGGRSDATNPDVPRRLHRGGPERRPARSPASRRRSPRSSAARCAARSTRRSRSRRTATSSGSSAGSWLESNLGYAVQDFYRNGGSTAIIVRVHKTKANDTRVDDARQRHARRLDLAAASPGAWGSKLTATIDDDVGRPVRHDALQPHGHRHRHGEDRGRSATSRSRPAARGASTSCSRTQSTLVRLDAARCRRSRSRRSRSTATATGGNDGDPIDGGALHDGAHSPRRQAGALRARERRPLQPARHPAVHGRRRDRRAVLARHDLVRERAARDADHRPAGRRWTRARQRGHRRAAHVHVSSKNAAVYFPQHPRARPAPATASSRRSRRAARSPGIWRAPTRRAACGRRRPALDATSAASSALSDPADRPRDRAAEPARRQLPAHARRARASRVWGARTREGNDRLASEWKYLPGAAHGALPRGVALPRHAVGRLRAERRAALGADPAQRRRVHERRSSARARSRARRRARRSSSSATPRRRRRTTSTSGSSTSSSASRR